MDMDMNDVLLVSDTYSDGYLKNSGHLLFSDSFDTDIRGLKNLISFLTFDTTPSYVLNCNS